VTIKAMDMRPVSYVFLDRDGVLNRKMPEGEYVRSWSQFEWLPGAEEAVARLNRAGMTTIVVSNQRGIALGLYTEADLEMIHFKMLGDLARRGASLGGVYYCPHDEGECNCRKPDIGMFEQAFQKFPDANPGNSVLMGDALSDIEAGRRLGMRTVFIRGDPSRQKVGSTTGAELADAVANSLLEAVETYLSL
jgi:D-glycero-D-manno-heptose 1,7-bisphosphate phosphatase